MNAVSGTGLREVTKNLMGCQPWESTGEESDLGFILSSGMNWCHLDIGEVL
jgi:hypothetical protein